METKDGTQTSLLEGHVSSTETPVTDPSIQTPWSSRAGQIWLLLCLSSFRMGNGVIYGALPIEVWPYQVEYLMGNDNVWKSVASGIVCFVMGIVGVGTSHWVGALGDRTLHRRRIAFWGACFSAVSLLSMSLWNGSIFSDIWTMLPVVGVCQLFYNAAIVNSESLMPLVLPFSYVSPCNTLKGALEVLGGVMGQLGAGYLIDYFPYNFLMYYGVLAGAMICFILPTCFGTRTTFQVPKQAIVTSGDLVDKVYHRNKWLIVIARFLVVGSIHGASPFVQYMFAEAFGYDYSTTAALFTGYFISVLYVAAFVGVIVGGVICAKVSSRVCVQLGSVFAFSGYGILAVCLGLVYEPPIWACAALVGLGLGFNMSSEHVLLVECSPRRSEMGSDFGLLNAASNAGHVLTPSLGGLLLSLMVYFGYTYHVAFATFCAVWGVVIVLALVLIALVRVPTYTGSSSKAGTVVPT